MSRYIFLTPDETIQTGDEYRTPTIDWRPHSGWAGRKVQLLLNQIGITGQMRRKTKKKVKRKVCVSWK